jgi:predicted nucleic acid-binding protein
MLVDTNIIIDYLRDKPQAIAFLENPDIHFSISVVTISELYAGTRSSAEEDEVHDFCRSLFVLSIGAEIAQLAGEYVRKYGKSHSVGIADALIAATAARHNLPLATLNMKHFPMLTNIAAPY